MRVPINFFLFFEVLPAEIERAGSFEQAVKRWRDYLRPADRQEIEKFLEKAASEPPADYLHLDAPELRNAFDIEFEEGHDSRTYFLEFLAAFRAP